jgi:hypothetical protein
VQSVLEVPSVLIVCANAATLNHFLKSRRLLLYCSEYISAAYNMPVSHNMRIIYMAYAIMCSVVENKIAFNGSFFLNDEL